jgi:chromosome segregation ATPase
MEPNTKIARLEKQLKELASELEQTRKENQASQALAVSLQESLNEEQKTSKRLQAECDELKAVHTGCQDAGTQHKADKTKIESLTQDVAVLRQTRTDLLQFMKDTFVVAPGMAADAFVDNSTEIVEATRKQLQWCELARDHMNSAHRTVSRQLRRSQGGVYWLVAHAEVQADLQRQIVAGRVEIARRGELNAALEEDLATLKEDIAALEDDIAALEENLTALEEDLAVREQDIAACEQDLAAREEDLAAREQDLAAREEDLAGLKDDNTALEEYIIGREYDIAALEQDYARADASLQTSLGEQTETSRRLQAENEELKASQLETVKELEETSVDVTNLEQARADLLQFMYSAIALPGTTTEQFMDDRASIVESTKEHLEVLEYAWDRTERMHTAVSNQLAEEQADVQRLLAGARQWSEAHREYMRVAAILRGQLTTAKDLLTGQDNHIATLTADVAARNARIEALLTAQQTALGEHLRVAVDLEKLKTSHSALKRFVEEIIRNEDTEAS